MHNPIIMSQLVYLVSHKKRILANLTTRLRYRTEADQLEMELTQTPNKESAGSTQLLLPTATQHTEYRDVKRTEVVQNRDKWLLLVNYEKRSCSIVGIASGYGLDDRRAGIRVPVGSRISTPPYRPGRL
jgi:hypothetical protein